MEGQNGSVADQTLSGFTEALAASSATPGGGSAAAVAASLGASLAAMVVRLSIGRDRYIEHAALHEEALAASDAARRRFLELADADAVAYAAYRSARSLPHDTEAQEAARQAAAREAAREATVVPLHMVEACQAQIELVERLAGRTNRFAASDLEAAALLLEGAARSAAANVDINLGAIGDQGFAGAVRAELDQRLQRIQTAADKTRERIARGGSRKPEDARP